MKELFTITLTFFDLIWLVLWMIFTIFLTKGITKPDMKSATWGTIGLFVLFLIITYR